MSDPIYKIMPQTDWAAALAAGVYTGSADDIRDGFIHFSTREQVPGTLAMHFASQQDLVLVAVDPAKLGSALIWEPSRGGALFPHFYGDLPAEAAVSVDAISGSTGD